MTEQTCETCRFCSGYLAPGWDMSSDDKLLCRRYPPPSRGDKGEWRNLPEVSRIDWCGEWAAKPQQAEG